MAAAFSTNAEEAFTKSIEISYRKKLADTEIESYYEISRCIDFIQTNNSRKVALQFPDELLEDSFKVCKLIETKASQAKVYVLGDTSYGSCCVDEVAAEHVKADCIIHFGRSCLSLTRRLPVLYVFGNESIDVDDCCSKFMETFPDVNHSIILLYDVVYQYKIDEIQRILNGKYTNIVVSSMVTSNSPNDEEVCAECGGRKRSSMIQKTKSCCGNSCDDDLELEGGSCSRIASLSLLNTCKCDDISKDDGISKIKLKHSSFGRMFDLHDDKLLQDYDIYFIGKESLTLTNLMMSYNKNKFYTYNPEQKNVRKEALNVNKALMKRYYLIQKAKDAKTVGIVAGTLGVADYMLILEQLKKLLKRAGKKFYTFMMGKPNVPKMANFMEIDIFVLVACPENSLIDSQEFYRPIITPFEMEVACSRARNWTGEYITDFRELLPGAASHVDFENVPDTEDPDNPDISLITGNLIQNSSTVEASHSEQTDRIMLRNEEMTLSTFGQNSAAEFLHTREWRGLEKQAGKTEVVKAVEGRKGISIGYTHEPGTEDS